MSSALWQLHRSRNFTLYMCMPGSLLTVYILVAESNQAKVTLLPNARLNFVSLVSVEIHNLHFKNRVVC